LQYANSAEISRINKGLKRRKNQTVLGFPIDPRTGYWAKSEDENPEGDTDPDIERPVRIVPIVQDRKNALLIRFHDPEAYKPETLATVQHALLRGIEVNYQLEEGEILGEPLPSRDNRRAILIYEATEGGAGVISRLIDEPDALGRVATQALALMHFDNVEHAVAKGDPDALTERDHEACVRGCYRCLLSYFNQPDHELIDRRSEEAKNLLIDLGRGRTIVAQRKNDADEDMGWQDMFQSAGIPASDATPVAIGDQEFPFSWRNHLIAATTDPIDDSVRQAAGVMGWTVFQLPDTPSAGIPDQMISTLKD